MAIVEQARTGRSRGLERARLVLDRYAAAWIGICVSLVAYAGAGVPSYWGDEAASVLSAQRPWSSLLAELGTVDAVHGAYYALLHLWIDVFGSSEWATRALSSIGIGLLAAGTVVLGRRWFDRRTGILAGLLVAVLPRASSLAIEARGYALAAAAAVWLTVLFLRLVERRASFLAWAGYGALVAAGGTFFLYLLLMPAVHLVALIGMRTDAALRRRIAAGLVVALLLALPIVIVGELQKSQIAFLAHRGYLSLPGVFVTPWFLRPGPAYVFWPLLIIGIFAAARAWWRARSGGFLPALTWLVLPVAALILIDVLIAPAYNPRYLSFCLGAVALIAARGVWAVVDAARGLGARAGVATATTGLVLLAAFTVLPEFAHQRTPYAKDGGADFRQSAADIAARARPGDTVLFGEVGRPSRAPRLAYRLYPDDFAGLHDPQLVTAYADTDGLWDRLAPVGEVAAELDGTVWLLEWGAHGSADADIAALREAGFAESSRTVIHRTVIHEFQRGARS